MLEVSFNELSLETQVINQAHAASLFKDFFSLCDDLGKLKIDTLRVRSVKDIKHKSFNGLYFSMENYLRTLKNDDRLRILGYLAQEPILAENPYYKFADQYVTGFGYAHENDLLSISVNNQGNWNEQEYDLLREYLEDGLDAEVTTTMVRVRHCPSLAALAGLESYLRDSYLKRKQYGIEEVNDLQMFWKDREELFPMLFFSADVEAVIHKHYSIHHPDFKKAAGYLKRLNDHLTLVRLNQAFFDQLPGDVSNEGEATLNKYGVERTFHMPDGNPVVFSLHVKLGGTVRIHLYPQQDLGKYVIGYIGPHLPTVKYN
jgi:hypothetical protein